MKIAPLIQTLYKGGRANNDSREEVAEETLMNGTNKDAYQDETHATSCKDAKKTERATLYTKTTDRATLNTKLTT